MMDALIAKDSMKEFKNVQGGGVTIQGHSIYLRLQADEALIKKYFDDKTVYRSAGCADVLSRLDGSRIEEYKKASVGFIDFSPKWNPNAVKQKRCLRGEPKLHWGGTNFVLIDQETFVVYLYSIGT